MKSPKNIFSIIICYLQSVVFLSAQTYFENVFSTIPSAVFKTALDIASDNHNPAALSLIKRSQLTIKFTPSRFSISEISPAYISYTHPFLDILTSGLSFSGISNQLYTELDGSISSGIELSDILKCGLKIEMLNINIKNYSSHYALRLNVGGILELSKSISAGFVLKNITRDYYNGAENTAIMSALFGFGITALDNLFFDIDASIILNHSSGVALASLYEFDNIIMLRLAILSNPRSIEFGAKINALEYLEFSGLINYHDVLGFSFQGGIYFLF